MEKFRKICLPCDLSAWPEVKKLLAMTRSVSTMEAWIHRLQKVYNAVHHCGSDENHGSIGAKHKSPSVFQGLSIYLNCYLPVDSRQRYLNEILPFLVERALQIEAFSAECDFVVPDGDTTIVLTRACACSLLACSLLCIFPDQNLPSTSRGRSFTFEGLYNEIACSGQYSDVSLQKLDCIFQYYELMSKHLVDGSEEIVFVRQILKNIPVLETWLNSQQPLCHLQVISSEVEKVRHNKNGHLIFFGEESFGSHVLGNGVDELEICFIENPELISAMVFFDLHVDNEVIVARGATRFTTFPPRPSLSGLHSAGTIRKSQPCDRPTICCSVLPHASHEHKSFMYRHKTVVRMSGKILSAFQQLSMDKSRFEEEEDDDDDENRDLSSRMEIEQDRPMTSTNEACSSNGMEVTSTDSRPPSFSSLRSSGSKRAQPWRSQSSTGSSGSIDWTRRTMSFELESSNQISSTSSGSLAGAVGGSGAVVAGGEEVTETGSRRRSSGLHSISRRSSGLSYQLSEEGGAYSRRRSSAMSEASQRSGFSTTSSSGSSGKRSSTDYSSEMEEYFDSFQKRSSIKTSVIEEETSGLMEEQGKSTRVKEKTKSEEHGRCRQFTSQRSLRRFVRDQPADALRPTPVKFASLDLPMMAIDNFTDNLINQVAQDSREEIARMAAKESERRRIRTQDLQHERTLLGPPKFLRRGHSADLFSFRSKEIYNRKLSETCPMKHRTPDESFVEKFADVTSRRIITSVFSEMGKTDGGSASIPYETPKSLEEFAGDFVEGVFGEAFQIIGGRVESGRTFRFSKTEPKRRGFFVDERQLKVYSKKEGDKKHVCTGSICFEEEDDFEDFEEDDEDEAETARSAREGSTLEVFCGRGEARGSSRPRTIGRSLSSGFRDPVLSDFEDLLVRSCINSPGRIMFTSGEGSTCGQSMDVDRTNNGALQVDRSRRSREGEIAAVCSRWFSGIGGEGPFDDYAEHFVVEIFRTAICQLFDNQTTASLPSLGYRPLSWQATVEDYSLNLVQCIMEGVMIDLERRTVAPPMVTCGVPCGVLGEKAHTAGKDDWSTGIQGLGDPVLIGHYRVGVYGDDPEIQALLYWLCASYMGLPSLVYCSHGNVQTSRLSLLSEAVLSRDWSVGTLFSELLLWCSTRVDQSKGSIMEGLIDFLLLRRLK